MDSRAENNPVAMYNLAMLERWRESAPPLEHTRPRTKYAHERIPDIQVHPYSALNVLRDEQLRDGKAKVNGKYKCA